MNLTHDAFRPGDRREIIIFCLSVPGRTCTDKPARRRLPEPLCLLFHHRDKMDGPGATRPLLPPTGLRAAPEP
jgi:hypothetical protein